MEMKNKQNILEGKFACYLEMGIDKRTGDMWHVIQQIYNAVKYLSQGSVGGIVICNPDENCLYMLTQTAGYC